MAQDARAPGKIQNLRALAPEADPGQPQERRICGLSLEILGSGRSPYPLTTPRDLSFLAPAGTGTSPPSGRDDTDPVAEDRFRAGLSAIEVSLRFSDGQVAVIVRRRCRGRRAACLGAHRRGLHLAVAGRRRGRGATALSQGPHLRLGRARRAVAPARRPPPTVSPRRPRRISRRWSEDCTLPACLTTPRDD